MAKFVDRPKTDGTEDDDNQNTDQRGKHPYIPLEHWGAAGIATRFGVVAGANHFTAIAPLADPGSPMTAAPEGTGGALGSKKVWIARIWAIAPKYFKYKMFIMARCRTARWTEAFHPEKEGSENVG